MKTKFTRTGKFKLVLFLTLCAVVLGCAVFLCFNIYNKNNVTAEGAEATQTEITAPEHSAKATATTTYAKPSLRDVYAYGEGTTTDTSWIGAPGSTFNYAWTSNVNSNLVVTNHGLKMGSGGTSGMVLKDSTETYGTFSITFALPANTSSTTYTWSDGTTAPVTLTIQTWGSLAKPSFCNVSSYGNGTQVGNTWTGEPGAIFNYASTKNATDSNLIITANGLKFGSGGGGAMLIKDGETYGTFTMTFSLPANYKWEDGTRDAVTFTIKTTGVAITPTLTYGTVTYGGGTVSPTLEGNTNNGKVTWSSSDATIATVDSNGVVTPVKAGTVTITADIAETIGNNGTAAGKATATVTVNQRAISNATMGAVSNVTYNGSPFTPTPTVTDSGLNKTLVNGTDFTYSYSNNKNAGTARVTITGKGNYTGTIYKDFTISPRNISNAVFGAIADQAFNNGLEIKPKPTVTDPALSATLAEDTDFEFGYENNTGVGEATVIITGKGNYTGTKTTTFTILGIDISECVIGTISNRIYDGTAQKPTATVTLNGVTLSSSTDFTFSYENNINAGEAKLTVTGKGNYAGKNSKTFKIDPRSITNATVAEIKAQPYTGEAVEPLPRITGLGRTLVKDTDYTLSYEHNIDAGTATVIITGTGNFEGTATVNFKIVADIDQVTLAGVEDEYEYTGSVVTPEPVVSWGDRTLVKGQDYTVSYENNTALGTATLTVTGIGDFNGTLTKDFEIVKADLTKATVTGISEKYAWTGTAIEPTVTLTLNGKALVKDTDYTVEYSENIAVGKATVTITGKDNYDGVITKNFDIGEVDLDDAEITGVEEEYGYTGEAITPEPVVTLSGKALVKDADYTVSYSANIDLGTVTVTVTGKGNYSSVKTVTFEIVAADITKATVADLEKEAYTGAAITPEPVITLNGKTLVKDTDYTLEYSDNTDIGEATVTITGKGNYSGTITKNFEIVQADIDEATVTGIEEEYIWTGEAITPDPTVTLNGTTLVKGTDYTVEYSANTDLGTATVKITGIGKYNSVKNINFEIVKADFSKATLSGIEKKYEYTGSEITPEPVITLNGKTLTEGTDYTVTYRNNKEVGLSAVVEVNGAGNYKGTLSTAFTIVKADISKAEITAIKASYEQTGEAIEPEPVVTLNGRTLVKGDDYTVEYENNVEIGVASYTVTGKGNYTGSVSGTFNITIALPTVVVTYVSYNGTDKLFVGKALPEITAVATYDGEPVEGTLKWDEQDPTLKEGQHDYYWIFTPADLDSYAVVTGFKTLKAEKQNYVAISVSWKGESQPELFTSTSIAVLKQNLKVTGILSSGDTDEIAGGYSIVGDWDKSGATNTVKMPTKGGDDFTITVTFGTWSDTIISVVIQDVVLTEFTAEPVDDDINKEYTALDKFDVSTITVTAKYNDGTVKILDLGGKGYSVNYENGADSLQYGDTKVTLSFTDKGVTKTAVIEDIIVSKKPIDKPIIFAPKDTDYNFGKPVTGGIELKDLPKGVTVNYIYEDEDGNIIDAANVKNAGKYKVTAKFTVDKNYEDIDDIIATFEVKKINPVLNPSVGGSLSVGKSLSELTLAAGGGAPAGKLTWDNGAYELQEGTNKCYYTFTPDDTVNYNTVHGYVEVSATTPAAPVVAEQSGGSLVGWQIALIIVSIAVLVISLIALVIALKARRSTDDSDGFYDDVTDKDLQA